MEGPRTRRLIALSIFLILALLASPLVGLAESDELQLQVAADAYLRDDEVILINRNDGRIVIRDYAVGTNMTNLNGKYDSFGGPYNDLAAGDFNGDGTKEIVAIGGRGVDAPGPNLNSLDPIAPVGGSLVPNIGAQLSTNVYPYDWLMVDCADVDGDGRDEIVAIRSTDEPGNILARIVCYEFESSWREKWNLATGGGFYHMDLADYDYDNKADVLLVRVFSYVLVLDGENPTQSHFEAQVGGVLADWTRGRIADVTGEGLKELVLMRPQQAASGNFPAAILVLHPKSAGEWDDVFGWGFGDPPEDMEIGDKNGDGMNEILAVNTGNFAKIYTLNPRLADDQVPPYGNRTEEELWIGDREWAGNLVLGDPNGDGALERLLVRADGTLLRMYGFNDPASYGDDNTYGPYADNFIAANLDASGISNTPIMHVPSAVTLFYELSSGTTTQALVRVSNLGGGTFTWTASDLQASNWLNISATSGTYGGTFILSLNKSNLPQTAGQTRETQVRVLATGGSGATVTNGDQTITVKAMVLQDVLQRFLPVVLR